MPLWPDEQLEHLKAALDAMEDAVMVLDADLNVVAFNQAAERLTGYRRQEAMGARCFEICAGRFCRRVCDIEALFSLGRAPEDFETPVLCKDGSVRLVRVRTVPVRGRRDRPVAAIRILRDVTERLMMAPAPQPTAGGYGQLVGRSPVVLRLYEVLHSLRDREAPLLLVGPPGTEKEWAARTLHQKGIRAVGPFVRVLTAGAPPALVENELFGNGGVGAIRLAERGTLYVEDAAELSWPAQQRLAAWLVEPQPIPGVRARLIVATEQDLTALADSGRFHRDLADLLLPGRVTIPPLAERLEDVPLLAERLLDEATPPGQAVPRLSDAAVAALVRYGLPGNIRELDRILRAAVVLSRGAAVIEPHHLPPLVHQAASPAGVPASMTGGSASIGPTAAPAMSRPPGEGDLPVSREHLLNLLAACHWRVGRCARQLGVDRTTLWRWMRRLDIHRPE